jgi:hypothetical protein
MNTPSNPLAPSRGARRRTGCGRAALALLVLSGSAALAQSRPPAPAPLATTSAAPTAAPGAIAAEDIHDIRGPKPLASPWVLPLIALTVALAAGGAYAAWAYNRRRLIEGAKRPLDVALERLERARELMQPAQARAFSIEVSTIVRDYIETRYRIKAAHLTTDEFLRDLLEPAGSTLLAHRALLGQFLETCDLAKFGGWNLSLEEMQTMLESARRFVIESAQPDAESETQTAAATPPAATPPAATPRETYVSLSTT